MILVIQEDSDQIIVIHVYVANIETRRYGQVERLGNTGLVRIFYAQPNIPDIIMESQTFNRQIVGGKIVIAGKFCLFAIMFCLLTVNRDYRLHNEKKNHKNSEHDRKQ